MKYILLSLWAVAAMAQTDERRAVGQEGPLPPIVSPCSITTTDVEGRIDNFAGGLEPTSTSAALTAFLAAIPPRSQYDETGCDKKFGETFRVCTCETCGGQLEIRVRRCAPNAGSNDGYTIGIAPFGPGKKVTGGTVWAPSDGLTKTLVIPLSATDLNKVLCGNHASELDVYIQDDTIVDWMRLTLQHP
ncbi:MAG TPA: hypothetical protein VFV49_00220 [Thermoanaerobaculia bacterium]|nr:hypothetical protein [Thermoanaerobaculia bacterium]